MFDNWSIEGRYDCKTGNKKHMGMLMLKSNKSEKVDLVPKISERCFHQHQMLQMQVIVVTFEDYDLTSAFIYTRQTPTKKQVKDLVQELSNVDLIIGDLNLDPKKQEDICKLELLCETRAKVLNEATTIRFNQLDHILLDTTKFSSFFATSYHNYTTDHNCLTVRIGKNDNKLKIPFLQRLSSTPEKTTKKMNQLQKPKKRKIPLIEGSTGVISCNEIHLKQENVNQSSSDFGNTDNGRDLTCLNPPNWLNDEVINNYLTLLRKQNRDVFSYTTYFYVAFSQKGFDGVRNYYRKYDILSFKTILIPIHYSNHWFLIQYNGKELISLDPYNYPESSGLKKEQLLNENRKFHDQFLKNLRDHYFKPLYSMYGKNWNEPLIHVKTPPYIPAQNNAFDCGVFLLTFSKYLVFDKKFDFTNDDMRDIRKEIRIELSDAKIHCHFGAVPSKKVRKITALNEQDYSVPTKVPKFQRNVNYRQRRFLNVDNEV